MKRQHWCQKKTLSTVRNVPINKSFFFFFFSFDVQMVQLTSANGGWPQTGPQRTVLTTPVLCVCTKNGACRTEMQCWAAVPHPPSRPLPLPPTVPSWGAEETSSPSNTIMNSKWDVRLLPCQSQCKIKIEAGRKWTSALDSDIRLSLKQHNHSNQSQS